MTKKMLYTGLIYLLAGLGFIACALIWELPGEGLLWGFGGAGIGGGVAMLWKYFYWSRPAKASEYAKRLDDERIELADERKIMLRDKSGRLTYVIMLYLCCFIAILCAALTAFGLMMPLSRYLALIFSGLILFQFLCGIVVFSYLNKRL